MSQQLEQKPSDSHRTLGERLLLRWVAQDGLHDWCQLRKPHLLPVCGTPHNMSSSGGRQ